MTAPSDVIAVILAAGSSRRFGKDKLLYPFHGRPLAAHIADTLEAMPLGWRIAICPADSPARIELFRERGFEVIENDDPTRGMGSSLALGAKRAIAVGAEAMLVCLGDMPNVTAAHLFSLIAGLGDGDVVATVANGTRSPPVILYARRLTEVTALTDDQGARHLLGSAAVVEASPELVRDFDVPEDFG